MKLWPSILLLALPLAAAETAVTAPGALTPAKPAVAQPVVAALDLGKLKAGQIITLPFTATRTGLISQAVCRVPGLALLERPLGLRTGEKSQVILFVQAGQSGPLKGSIEFSIGKDNEALAVMAQVEGGTAPSIPALPPRVQRSYDASIYVDAKSVREQPASILCDLRHFHEVQSVSLPGALTFRLEDLRNSPQFRERPLVLIGGGPLDRDLEADCQRLRQAGCTQVRILRGGLAAWSQAGGSLNGSKESALSCSPLDAILARDFAQTVFVNACTRPVPTQLIRDTLSLEAAAKLPPGSDFIILTDDGKISKIPQLPGPSFVLAGGLKALEAKAQEIARLQESGKMLLTSARKGCGCS